jgi:TonB family protein
MLTSVSTRFVFMLECACELAHDLLTDGMCIEIICCFTSLTARSKRKAMMANFRICAFRLLKPAALVLIAGLLCNTLASPASSQTSQAQTNTRKLKYSVPPEYPELARKTNIQGVARVLLTVAADGKVVAVKELGGNPVLVAALVQAVRKWKYEPADHDSEIEVKFEFVQKNS